MIKIFTESQVSNRMQLLFQKMEMQEFELMDACEIVYLITRLILKGYYDVFEPTSFPIDIRGIVKQHGISIYETNLNAGMSFRMEKINGYYRKTKIGQHEINLENRDSEFTKRYILAHEFGHFIVSEFLNQDGSSLTSYCTDPFFPKSWMEIFCDLVANFLMFPPMLLLNYLDSYTQRMEKQMSYPIDSFAWLTDLGQKAQISLYFTILSYQYNKLFMCWLYNHKDFVEKVLGIDYMMKFEENYKKFFK